MRYFILATVLFGQIQPVFAGDLRSYTLSSPEAGRRVVREYADEPVVRTGNETFDALFAMAIEERRENSVAEISDPSFATFPCNCFQTGELWRYVWTRDTAYSVELGLGLLDPQRARESLLFKLSALRDGASPQIVQDTGTGGSWPVSTDRVVWAMGAWELLKYLDGSERESFRDQAYEAIVNTIESDRAVVYDPHDGLYRGEQSFLDWREQTYPSWTAENVIHIAGSKTLSTNIVHFNILKIAAALAFEKNDFTMAGRFGSMADDLRAAIAREFWLRDAGLFGTMKPSHLDTAVVHKYDLLGSSLAVLSGIGTDEQARSVVAQTSRVPAGSPVIWPQQPFTPVYHNRAIWPFVTAYSARAGRAVKNAAAVHHDIMSLVRGAGRALSNMENFEFLSQSTQGPVVNSRRQLWSVAGYASAVIDVLFGKEATQTAIRFQPFIPSATRDEFWGGQDKIALHRLSYRGHLLDVVLRFPAEALGDGYFVADRVMLNGLEIASDKFVTPVELRDHDSVFDIALRFVPERGVVKIVDSADFRDLWAPKEPLLTSMRVGANGNVRLEFNSNGERDVVFNIYRDGVMVAAGLSRTTWEDQDGAGLCYGVEAQYVTSGNVSYRSAPQCLQRDGVTDEIHADDARWVVHDGATREINHGRYHFNDWGRPEQALTLQGYVPRASGKYMFQLVYGNGYDISTGVTAGVKRVEILRANVVVASGFAVMPHLKNWDTWAESTGVAADLEAGRSYTVRISDAFNMSYFAHFNAYKGRGGRDGAVNRVNLSGVIIFSR